MRSTSLLLIGVLSAFTLISCQQNIDDTDPVPPPEPPPVNTVPRRIVEVTAEKDSNVVDLAYNNKGLVEKITENYYEGGVLVYHGETFPAYSADNKISSTTYAEVDYTNQQSTRYYVNYFKDNTGKIIGARVSDSADVNQVGYTKYSYDANNRLQTMAPTLDSIDYFSGGREAYVYIDSFTYDAANHLTGSYFLYRNGGPGADYVTVETLKYSNFDTKQATIPGGMNAYFILEESVLLGANNVGTYQVESYSGGVPTGTETVNMNTTYDAAGRAVKTVTSGPDNGYGLGVFLSNAVERRYYY